MGGGVALGLGLRLREVRLGWRREGGRWAGKGVCLGIQGGKVGGWGFLWGAFLGGVWEKVFVDT